MANYSIPNWAMERFQDIEDYMLLCMTVLVETDQMKRLYSGNSIYIYHNNISINNIYFVQVT